MKESQFQKKLLTEINKYGWFYKASDRFKAGIPDLIGTFCGEFTVIEVKVDYRKVTDLQYYEFKKIAVCRGNVYVAKYINKTKLIKIGLKEFKTVKEAVACIIKQSHLNIRLNALWLLGTDHITGYSLSQDLESPK